MAFDLRSDLIKALSRNRNADSLKEFLLGTEIDDLLSASKIQECIEESNIDLLKKDDCIQAIFPGGRKVFAILLLINRIDLIPNFVQADQMSKENLLDYRLPFSLEDLTAKFGDEATAIDFRKRQWEVAVPFLRQDLSYRSFHEDTILPFIKSEPLGSGGFGEVSIVTIPSGQHEFGPKPRGKIRVVRKTLIPPKDKKKGTDSIKKSFENEERILSLLRSLRHANIVQLLASYTIEKKNAAKEHVLLFSRADYTLSKMLKSMPIEVWNDEFPSHYDVFQGLYGLSSAIQSLHEYGSEKFKIELIGCHFDLAPRNILVHNGTFLLADFGLSRFNDSDISKTIFKTGKGDYLAPECLPITDGSFRKGIVSRPSDIWSFGCVILEILTYMRGGTDEIAKFRKDRRERFREFTAAQFHCFGNRKDVVDQYMDDLEVYFGSEKLFKVLREMLQIEPTTRPLSSAITPALFLHAQTSLLEPIRRSFDLIVEQTSALEIKIEKERLTLWAWAADLLQLKREKFSLWDWASKLFQLNYVDSFSQDADHDRDWLLKSSNFEEVNSILLLIRDELSYIKKLPQDKDTTTWPIYSQLQGYIDRLWMLLPRTLAGTATNLLEEKMLETEDRELLRKTFTAFGDNSSYTNIARLAAMKYMIAEVSDEKHKKHDEKLLWKQNVTSREIGLHRFARIPVFKDSSEEKNVLIERISYNPGWSQNHGTELFRRVGKLATLLNTEKPAAFRTLKCVKYFHEPQIHAFSLVYDFPPKSKEGGGMPDTLKDLIRKFQRPDLGTLFNLATLITSCVQSFHTTTWLHKNISSHTILFFDYHLKRFDERSEETVRRDMYPFLETPGPESKMYQKPAIPHKKSGIFKISFGKEKDKLAPKGSRGTSPSSLSATPSVDLPTLSRSFEYPDSRPSLPTECRLDEPYLVGLNHTRTDSDEAFTTGASHNPKLRIYQHPEYQRKRAEERFRLEYDYYSLGLVLLEIGMWESLETLAPHSSGKNASLIYLSEVVPRLSYAMGNVYRDVVKVCLEGNFGDGTGESPKRTEIFHQLVVSKIKRCYA